jgi:hypothetical protein
VSAYRPFLKDKHRGRTLVGSKSGTTPRPAILCRGGELGESCRPEELWLAIGGKGRRRGPEGEGQDRAKTGPRQGQDRGPFGAIFARAPHGVMQTHGQPPRPSMFAHL